MVKVEIHDDDSTNDAFMFKNDGASSSKPYSDPAFKEVKEEDQHSDILLHDQILCRNTGSSSKKPSSDPPRVKEEDHRSSSPSDLKLHFVGMGFSSVLVDRVLEENGYGDENMLLEALIKYSNSSPEASDSWEDFSTSEKEEESSFVDFTSDNKEDMKELCRPSNAELKKRSHLAKMDFSQEEIELAMSRIGVYASLPELVDFIVTAQTAGSSGEKIKVFIDCDSDENEEATTAALFGTMDKTLCLLQMGFTENEVSSAIDKFGSEVPINVLANKIIASRMAFNVDKQEDLWDETDITGQNQNGVGPLNHATEKAPKRSRLTTDEWITKASTLSDQYITKVSSSDDAWMTKASTSNAVFHDGDEKIIKKSKSILMEDDTACYSNHMQQAKQGDWEANFETKPNQYHESQRSAQVKEEMPNLRTPGLGSNFAGLLSKSPFFFYANVVDISQGTWRKLSQFLYATEPEFTNCQFFSALIRKEGYLHNLPTGGRFRLIPMSPMTIEDVIPHSKKWWPSWDTRKQLSCISSENTGVAQLCERLGKMMMDSQGFLSKEQQTDIIHQCKRLNLIWVGQNKLRPMEPDQVERILGYPRDHTEIWNWQPIDRLAALRYCFQVDTIGYHLSVLKSMFPNGLRVLSIFSGLGGAEIALDRVGIRLKCVVSVEASEIKRNILKRWWQKTGQTGMLKQIGGIEKLTTKTLESYVNQFGGFDIIIGSNPVESAQDGAIDMDINLYFEFVRVFQRVRSMMGR